MAIAQENPLLEGLEVRRAPDPCILVIFGASGDLTKRKLFPALYSLAYRRLLPENFAVVGVSRSEETDDEFRDRMKEAVQEHSRDDFREDVWELLAGGMRYVAMDFADEEGEDRLAETLTELDKERETQGNRVYYLATPPSVFETVVSAVGKRRTAQGWVRLIIEKPFGHDLASARELQKVIEKYFDEREVFRIDHYLGKETVQNMMALRFANGIFEPIWNRQFVDHVQITVAETMGIGERAGYYEQAGAIRDIFQNHMLQLIAITAMEPPIDFTADSVRNEKVKVLRAMHTPGPKSVVRGQYGRGYIEGEEVPGYREESGVEPGLDDGHICGREAVRRQLALGRHSLLCAYGQAARASRDDDRDSVQACAAPAVRGAVRRASQAERPDRPRTARRGSVARHRRQGSRTRHDDPDRAHGLPLRRRLPDGSAGGL